MSRNSIDRAKSNVIEQACEAAAAGNGSCTDELRVAVIAYYRACGDDEMADDLEAEDHSPTPTDAQSGEETV